jgi:hypothetical protein
MSNFSITITLLVSEGCMAIHYKKTSALKKSAEAVKRLVS